MTILELLQQVKDERLDLHQLESYYDQLSNLFTDLMLEMSSLEKKEAQYLASKTPDDSVAWMKIQWRGTHDGQRLIELKRYQLALKELFNSIKSRIYRHIH